MIGIQMINMIKTISINAGKKILDVYNSEEFSIEAKPDTSPLTQADIASNNIIISGLKGVNEQFNLNYPILSEESNSIDYLERKLWSKYWLIDPLDGTKEFIKRNGEFTVNIALIDNNIPVLGFVYVPVLDVLYYTQDNKAYKLTEASTGVNNVQLLNVYNDGSDSLTVVASKSHLNEETKKIIDTVTMYFKKTNFCSYGSSLKLCKVAEGSANFYPRIAPTMEWDTAAADAICRAAGCIVMNYDNNKPLVYNKENLLNPYFYVTSNKKVQEIMETN